MFNCDCPSDGLIRIYVGPLLAMFALLLSDFAILLYDEHNGYVDMRKRVTC